MSDLNVEAPLKNLYQISYPNNSVGNCRLSCIGNVTGFKDGHVEVKWATGLMTKVVPYEIFRIGKHEASTATPVSYETNIEELTEEITEHGSLPSDQKGKIVTMIEINVKSIKERVVLFPCLKLPLNFSL
ncbi:hypothetical protein MtrunA17_Chr4g0009071 [Medicago truncatula]|uniref:UBE2O-like SH3-C domain-containing protein n=1 Tax=Medicago truncatula TaxID=3880 RepID=A0A396I0E8_MEDTR|nr:hypothetical protein MtrunA17_Chr4g0009071 [Medicago truncatula]